MRSIGSATTSSCAFRGTSEPSARWRSSADGCRRSPLAAARSPGPRGRGRAGRGLSLDVVDLRMVGGRSGETERISDLSKAAIDLAEFVSALQSIEPNGWAVAEQIQRVSRCAARYARREHARVDRRPGLEDRRRRGDDRLGSRPSRTGLGAIVRLDPRRPRRSQPAGQKGQDHGRHRLGLSRRRRPRVRRGGRVEDARRGNTRRLPDGALDRRATWARGHGWVLSQALNALSYYTLETNAVLVREAERWLAEAVAPPPPAS